MEPTKPSSPLRRRAAKLLIFSLVTAGTVLAIVYLSNQKNQKELYRRIHNQGELTVYNPFRAAVSLTRIHHYEDEKRYHQGIIPFKGLSIDLTGPADYTLTAHKEQWVGSVQYPVYIQGHGHRVEVTVRPPPERVPEGMVYIPAGVFRMGDKDENDAYNPGEERPHHDVELDAFFIGKTEVTNADYRDFMFGRGYNDKESWSPDGWEFIQNDRLPDEWIKDMIAKPNHPVGGVSWYGAQAYCRWKGKRLPTEAEWEKAAVGPEGYKWSFGNTWDESKLSHDSMAPIGMYEPNGYGLYDMSGNAWEYCYDWYDSRYYDVSPKKNPTGPETGTRKMTRWGAWDNASEEGRLTARDWDPITERDSIVGFRCVLDCD